MGEDYSANIWNNPRRTETNLGPVKQVRVDLFKSTSVPLTSSFQSTMDVDIDSDGTPVDITCQWLILNQLGLKSTYQFKVVRNASTENKEIQIPSGFTYASEIPDGFQHQMSIELADVNPPKGKNNYELQIKTANPGGTQQSFGHIMKALSIVPL